MCYYNIGQLICMQNPAYRWMCKISSLRNGNAGNPNSKWNWRMKNKPERNQIDCQRLQSGIRSNFRCDSKFKRPMRFSSSLLFYFKKMIPQTRWACNVEQLAIANNVLFSFFFFFAFDFVLENCMVHSMLNIILAHILIFTFAPLSMAKINLCI